MGSVNFDEYFSRQIKVPGFGRGAQKKLQKTKCLVVGMGGLGCPVSLYLAASGIGTLGICDNDKVEVSNINRQILYSIKDIGKRKVIATKEKLKGSYPFLTIIPHIFRLGEKQCLNLIARYDLVIDCTDNFHSKYLIHDACLELHVPLVQGGIYQCYGQVFSFQFSKRKSQGPCMRCIWREEPDGICTRSCEDAGVLTVLAGSIAITQCMTAMQMILKPSFKQPTMRLFTYDTQQWQTITVPIQKKCICQSVKRSNLPEITRLKQNTSLEIEKFPNSKSWNLLDLRPEKEQGMRKYLTHKNPLCISYKEISNIQYLLKRLEPQKKYVLMCTAGVLSLHITKQLRSYGYFNTFSLAGGYKGLQK